MTLRSDYYREKEVLFQLNQNICLSAGAGSGKTSALVKMYCALISGESSFKEPIAIERIVAITFTEKAAAEMKKRVREALELKLRSSEGGIFWKDRLRKLEWAPIKTIHSFCAGIIREHPVEAKVDPAFTILDDYATAEQLEKIINEVVMNGLFKKDPVVRQLVYDYGFSRTPYVSGLGDFLQNVCRQLYGSGLNWNELNQLLEQNHKRAEKCLSTNIHLIQEDLARLDEAMKNGAVKKSAKSYVSIKELLRYYHTAMDTWGGNDVEGGSLLLPLEHYLKGKWPLAVSTLKKDLLHCVTEMRVAYYQVLCRECLEGFQHILEDVTEGYQRWKVQQGVLDFDDLLVRTRDMLRSNIGIRRELKGRFKVIMLDEFQDTNRVQKEIVYYLAEAQRRDYLVGDHEAYHDVLNLHPQKLYIVGDPKQSIYSFRGADVSVFLEVQSHLAREGTEGQSFSLSENFRCHKGIVAFSNRFFSFIMRDGTAGYEVNFNHDDHQLFQRKAMDEGPRVELITIGRGQGGEQKRRIEAAALSRRILEIVNPHRSLTVYERDERGREKRKTHPDFSDIAILFRRFTHVKLYERELRRRAIPYYVVKGRGFFGCQEIKDIINFLKYLDGESDAIALVGILRSPLVGISDETLYWLLKGVGKERRPVTAKVIEEQYLKVQSRITDEDKHNLRNFLYVFNKIRGEKDRFSPAELIEKIVQTTHYDAVMLTTFQGEQKVANIIKLIELSRNFSRKETGLLRDFIGYLLKLVEGGSLEAEAQVVLENANVVKLMTIHQAKGLEFPIVFLPDMGHSLQQHFDPIIFDESKGMAMKFYHEAKVSYETTMSYREITQLKRSKDYAESKRLLYVAATRARDYLIMSGEKSDKKGGECWREWLDQFLVSHPELVCMLREEDISDRVPSNSKNLYQYEPGYKRLAQVSVHAGKRSEALSRKILQQSCFYTDYPAEEVYITVTALSDYMVCPQRFYYLHCLGLHERIVGTGRREYGEDQRKSTHNLSDLARGNMLHFVLKHINFTRERAHREEEIKSLLLRQGVTSERGEIEELKGMVLSFLSSDLGSAIASSGQAYALREIPFTLRLHDESSSVTAVMQGAIDLLYRDVKGVWTVVDYKYAAGRDIDRKRYKMQLMAYGLAVLKRSNEGTIKLIIKVMEERDREPEEWYVTRDELLPFEEQVITCAREIARGQVGDMSGGSIRGGRKDCHYLDCTYRAKCYG
jgi:ATP-dependent exoDNAse (exonuclease V) beta subunit